MFKHIQIMEHQQRATFKRKRKGFRTNLTTNKKSKRYRLDRINKDITHIDSFSSSESSPVQISTPNASPGKRKQLLCPQKIENSQFFSLKQQISTSDKSTQACPNMRTKTFQTSVNTRSRKTQTWNTKYETNSCSMQTVSNPSSNQCEEKLLCLLWKDNNLFHFAQQLSACDQTDKFVQCVQAIGTGKLPTTNLAWKSFLDMGTMFCLKSTINMEYDPEWLEFCQVLYHMFSAGVINALRGRGHFSHVTSNRTGKNKYDPVTGEFNFPIPSIPMLKKLHFGFPSEIPVGFVNESLDIAEKKAKLGSQFVLSFDGKLIAPGCKGDRNGDSNMWGLEGPPNLSHAVAILQTTLQASENVNITIDNSTLSSHFYNLRRLLNLSSLRIKRLRSRITGSFYLHKKLIQKCGNSSELQYKHRKKMSSLNQNTAECQSVVRHLLEINLTMTQIMAWINSNADVHVRDNIRHISLIDNSNNFQLLQPEIVQLNFDLTQQENYQFIKQRSEEWFTVRKLARITGSTLNAALGLDTLQKQKDHHHVFVRGQKPPPIPDDLQQKFDHGTKNEVNAIATIISTIIPAYLPACFAFYEVGPAFVGSEKNENLLEVSADGLLQCSSGYESCLNYELHGNRKIVVEIKSPTPQENVAETIFYEVPNRYVPQLLAEMQGYNCPEVWLLCSTPVSASLIQMKNNSHLWTQLWELCCFLYKDEKQNVPTKLHPSVKNLKIAIANEKQRMSTFLCEVPTITG